MTASRFWIGVEFMHIQESEPKNWIQERLERVKDRRDFTPKFRKAILERLIAAESFERFLHKRFIGTKRFGLDGSDPEAVGPAHGVGDVSGGDHRFRRHTAVIEAVAAHLSALDQHRGGTELDLMRSLKDALDPANTLNPGKVI